MRRVSLSPQLVCLLLIIIIIIILLYNKYIIIMLYDDECHYKTWPQAHVSVPDCTPPHMLTLDSADR